jgi:molecular chaperone GrpE
MIETKSPHDSDELESEEFESDEFEIDSDESDDIEAAMKDALKAVESVSTEGQDEPEIGAATQADPGISTASEIPEIDLEVNQLRAEAADLRDQTARTLADFDNFRKRADKERDEDRRYATAELFRQLLPVIDNLERALSAHGPEQDLKVGVALVLRQIQDLLRNSGVERVPAMGEVFDPQLHEAVSRHEDPSVDTPIVSDELQSGYRMHGRLLRPAVVKVAMPVIDDEAAADSAGKDR